MCVVCGNTRVKDPSVSMHRFPQNKTKRLRWLKALGLKDDDVGSHHQVCSRHFPEGDTKSHDPQLSLRKKFASPKKWWTGQANRAKRWEAAQNLFSKESHSKTSGKNPSSGSTSANDGALSSPFSSVSATDEGSGWQSTAFEDWTSWGRKQGFEVKAIKGCKLWLEMMTWFSYSYHHLKEVKWMPEVEQVRATLPQLQLQSSMWSSYKHHNTA